MLMQMLRILSISVVKIETRIQFLHIKEQVIKFSGHFKKIEAYRNHRKFDEEFEQ